MSRSARFCEPNGLLQVLPRICKKIQKMEIKTSLASEVNAANPLSTAKKPGSRSTQFCIHLFYWTYTTGANLCLARWPREGPLVSKSTMGRSFRLINCVLFMNLACCVCTPPSPASVSLTADSGIWGWIFSWGWWNVWAVTFDECRHTRNRESQHFLLFSSHQQHLLSMAPTFNEFGHK